MESNKKRKRVNVWKKSVKKEANVESNSHITTVGDKTITSKAPVKHYRESVLKLNGTLWLNKIKDKYRSHMGKGTYIEILITYNKGSKHPVNIWQLDGDNERTSLIGSAQFPHLFGLENPIPTLKAQVRGRLNLASISDSAVKKRRVVIDAQFKTELDKHFYNFYLSEFLGKVDGFVKSQTMARGVIKHLDRGDDDTIGFLPSKANTK